VHAAAVVCPAQVTVGVPEQVVDALHEHPCCAMQRLDPEMIEHGSESPEHELVDVLQKHPCCSPHAKLEKRLKHDVDRPVHAPLPLLKHPGTWLHVTSESQVKTVPMQAGPASSLPASTPRLPRLEVPASSTTVPGPESLVDASWPASVTNTEGPASRVGVSSPPELPELEEHARDASPRQRRTAETDEAFAASFMGRVCTRPCLPGNRFDCHPFG
jgi:hypothetical protein